MLILGRHEGQSILVGDDMTLTLDEIETETVGDANRHTAITTIRSPDGTFTLSLQWNARFKINDDVEIVIVDVNSVKVRYGFIAPGLTIDRSEVRERADYIGRKDGLT